jgi:hypothetical protein
MRLPGRNERCALLHHFALTRCSRNALTLSGRSKSSYNSSHADGCIHGRPSQHSTNRGSKFQLTHSSPRLTATSANRSIEPRPSAANLAKCVERNVGCGVRIPHPNRCCRHRLMEEKSAAVVMMSRSFGLLSRPIFQRSKLPPMPQRIPSRSGAISWARTRGGGHCAVSGCTTRSAHTSLANYRAVFVEKLEVDDKLGGDTASVQTPIGTIQSISQS